MILHFRQKQEFKGQKPFGVVTLRGHIENAAENAGKYRRGYRDSKDFACKDTGELVGKS